MLRSILPAIKTDITLAMPEGRNYDELFQDFGHVTVELADGPGKTHQPIAMHPEDCCLPVECGRPIKPRICLEHDFQVFDYTYRIRPLGLDLSGVNRPGVNDTLRRLKLVPGRYVVVSAHGASSPTRKDCPIEMAGWICSAIQGTGFTPLLLNYGNDRHYPWSESGGVWQTNGWPMDATSLWWTLAGASAVIAIDSGPLHMALTVPELPCLFIKNQIDFMRFFYDAGLEQVREVLPVTTPKPQTIQKVSQFLCSNVQ